MKKGKVSIKKPKFKILKFLYKIKYFHFFITGTTGVLLNLFFVWIFVNFVFLKEGYLLFKVILRRTTIAIIIGQTINLIYNFILHTKMTFKTKKNHKKRFLIFVFYSLFMSYFIITPISLLLRNFLEFISTKNYLIFITGKEYLFSTAIVILFFSIINFILFKLFLFKEKN